MNGIDFVTPLITQRTINNRRQNVSPKPIAVKSELNTLNIFDIDENHDKLLMRKSKGISVLRNTQERMVDASGEMVKNAIIFHSIQAQFAN